jgi:serine protease Do
VVAITTKQMVEERAHTIPDDLPLGDFFRRNFDDPSQPGPQRHRRALGSGFMISSDGYIVTNNHVVENASEIQVLFRDKANVPAKLVGRDPATDIAVLKIDPRPNMTTASWGDSDAVEPGAWTIAIGSPFGLGGTVTIGVLSARSRDIEAGPYDDFLQTDASINQGNSGGPLFNARGEVIGVNTAIFSPSGGNIGIGFAVPSKSAQAVTDQLIRSGKVERGYLGVRLQDLTQSIARALGLRDSNGALVTVAVPGGPADKAGIKAGDVVTRFNNEPVASARDLSVAVAGQKPGTEAAIVVYRDGRSHNLKGSIGQQQDDRTAQTGTIPEQDTGKRLGLALAPVPDGARSKLGMAPSAGGLVVQRVEPNSPAAENGIKAGDVIVSANGRDVSGPAQVAEEWAKSQQQDRPILLRLNREGHQAFVAVEP